MDSAAAGMRDSALDLLAALLTGRAPAAAQDDGDQSRRLLALLATSLAVLVGCGIALLFHRSSSAAAPLAQKAATAKPLAVKKDQEPDPDGSRQQVALLFGTQTGTAKGFAKALAEEAKARYDKAVFKVLDLDEYAAEDEEYEEKLKKENITFFFLAILVAVGYSFWHDMPILAPVVLFLLLG